jgi:hypothetical protein
MDPANGLLLTTTMRYDSPFQLPVFPQASSNTMRYKARDSAAGISRKLSSIDNFAGVLEQIPLLLLNW